MIDLSTLKSSDQNEAQALKSVNTPFVCLIPVGSWILGYPELVENMSRWRFLASEMFFTRFPQSAESMTHYLLSHAIQNPRNILFMVSDESKKFLGHLGLKNIVGSIGEVDFVMKNPDVSSPRSMQNAISTLVNFAENELGITELTLEVISTNKPALNLYAKQGFVIEANHHLLRVTDGVLTNHVKVSKGLANVNYTSVTMKLKIQESEI